MRHSKTASLTVLLAGGSLLSAGVALGAPLIDLGTLGGAESRAFAINDAGQVVGEATTGSGDVHAFLYSGGTMNDLGTLGGPFSRAVAINSSGQVAGVSTTSGGATHAFLYSGGSMIDLGDFGGGYAEVLGLNDAGQVVGFMNDANSPPESHAFLYSGGVTTDLTTLPGSLVMTRAVAINDAGLVAGECITAENALHACSVSGTTVTDLSAPGFANFSVDVNSGGTIVGIGALGPDGVHGFTHSSGSVVDMGTLGGMTNYPSAINDAGTVIGLSQDQDGTSHAYFYSGGSYHDLGSLGGQVSSAVAINASGQIVGSGNNAAGDQHAYLYSNDRMIDLGTLGSAFSEASDINASGQVVGTSLNFVGHYHAFLRNNACGDGVLDPSEDCDDGNAVDGDCCASDCTYPGPATGCLVPTKASLTIKDNDSDDKDSLKWSWGGGGPVLQGDLGDPSSTTTYTLCVSDSTGGVDRLVAQAVIAPGSAWTDKDPKGWSYVDKTGASSGVTRATIGAGDAGKAKAQVAAKGAALQMPAAFSAAEMFDQDTRVTVQLFTSAGPTCWTSEFTTTKKNTTAAFQAKLP